VLSGVAKGATAAAPSSGTIDKVSGLADEELCEGEGEVTNVSGGDRAILDLAGKQCVAVGGGVAVAVGVGVGVGAPHPSCHLSSK